MGWQRMHCTGESRDMGLHISSQHSVAFSSVTRVTSLLHLTLSCWSIQEQQLQSGADIRDAHLAQSARSTAEAGATDIPRTSYPLAQ